MTSPPSNTLLDILIVGGSNAGLSAALVLGRARRQVVLLNHGQPRNAPSPGVHGFLTRDGTPPAELRRIAYEQLKPYPSVTVRSGEAAQARRHAEGFSVTTRAGETYRARAVLLASGVVDELPPLPGLAERWGHQVVHCPYCHGWEVRERPLAVLSNEPWTCEYALTVRGWSDDLVLLTNGPAALDDSERQRLLRNAIQINEHPISRLDAGPEGQVRVVFDDGSLLDRSALFHRPRQHQASDLARQLGCELHTPIPGTEIIQVDPMGQTTVHGVYAAGDAATMMQQAIVAASAGMVAASMLNRELLQQDFA
ncbi:MAG: NAD(P)/FAD-dependent oxidoreductase [Herpetosiphonaceae bacterium]|nr:NAD(P)/FAD-dependent oxidoreductase [Herpetosiphonaceae bacterium]